MNPPIDYGYHQDSCSDPPQAPDYFDQHLELIQYPYSSLDSAGIQSEQSSFAASLAPTWFSDFILYDPDDTNFQPDSMSINTNCDIPTVPLFASSPRSVPISTDTDVPNDTSFYRWYNQTELDEVDYAVAFGSNSPNFQWESTEPALNQSTSSHFESEPNEDSEQSSPTASIQAENDAMGRLPVPRMPPFECPTCQSQYPSKSRLSEHRRKSHPPARFTCGTCDRGFKLEKDLRRHQLTHEPKQLFACSCTKTYTRRDGLLRHVNDMAMRPREAGRHTAVKSNPR